MHYIITLLFYITSTFAFGGNVQSLRSDNNGNISAAIRGENSVTIPSIESGEYLAEFSSPANCGTPSDAIVRYQKIGKIVSIYGQASCVVTTINLDTFVVMTLPFVPVDNVMTGSSIWSRLVAGTLSGAGYVEADGTGNARLRIRRVSSSLNNNIYFNFVYEAE